MGNKLTSKEYWESTYGERSRLNPIQLSGFKHHCAREIFKIIQRAAKDANSVLEVGGGGSAWLAYLASTYPTRQFASLDYSEEGGQMLRSFMEDNGIENLRVFTEDFFSPSDAVGKFDFVYSHGVVEHFGDLSGVLSAHAGFVADGGIMLTLIPNMAGLNGRLTRWFNQGVYDIHVPHDLGSFEFGHLDAGLEIVESGYLCSNNFGVLSSCVRSRRGIKWNMYKWLTRLSKSVWFFESKLAGLPASKTFSPYIYVVSKKKADD